jgi:hypothetical protein
VSVLDALKGNNGGYELTRIIGAAGGVAYILCANGFVAWELHLGRGFDVTAYCLAFPGGLAAILAAVAGGAAWKDKGVASAKVIERTGGQPKADDRP